MQAYEIYGIIADSEVKQIIPYLIDSGGYTLAQVAAFKLFGPQSVAVEVTHYPVSIGDKYHNGKFWKVANNTEIEINPFPSEEEDIALLKSAQEDTDNLILDHEERIILRETE